MTNTVIITILIGILMSWTNVFAQCKDWEEFDGYPDISHRWCTPDHDVNYEGGARMYSAQFKNDSDQTVEIICKVQTESQYPSTFSATVHPGQSTSSGGNFTIAKTIKSSSCSIKIKSNINRAGSSSRKISCKPGQTPNLIDFNTGEISCH